MTSFGRSHPDIMVVQRGTGDGIGYFVVKDYFDPALAGPFFSHAEAWRWIDRHSGDPINKSEDRAQWAFDSRQP